MKKSIGMSFLGIVILLGSFSLVWSKDKKKEEKAKPDREISLVNIRYEGKVLWVPGTIIVKKGERVKLNLYNSVPEDPNAHGFSITAFDVRVDVSRGAAESVEFVADQSGVFTISCHLHPAHLKGQILVIE